MSFNNKKVYQKRSPEKSNQPQQKFCNNWKREGKCPMKFCKFLHKTCELENCHSADCQGFHDINKKNVENLLATFRKKCLICENLKLLVFFICAHQNTCLECAEELIKNKTSCLTCGQKIMSYIA